MQRRETCTKYLLLWLLLLASFEEIMVYLVQKVVLLCGFIVRERLSKAKKKKKKKQSRRESKANEKAA